jgi:hypothetical protein
MATARARTWPLGTRRARNGYGEGQDTERRLGHKGTRNRAESVTRTYHCLGHGKGQDMQTTMMPM